MSKQIYTEDHKNIIRKIIIARREAGLSQKDVASSLVKSQSYISKIESGQRKIDVLLLKDFAKLYKKSIHFFIH